MHFNELLLVFVFCIGILNKGNAQTWTCNDGSKIQADWKCDGETDCLDGSDESTDNCPHRECQFDEFECTSGTCIPYVFVCNGEVDCGIGGVYDDSDERQNCANVQKITDCDLTSKHKCTNGLCIPQSWICDGANDCGDKSDETNCSEVCPQGHIMCNRTSTCIDARWICDGQNDCTDGEDESKCSTEIAPATSTTSKCDFGEFFCGDNCLPIEKACDGNLDCSSGVDEGDHCKINACRRRSDPLVWSSEGPLCDQLCRPTPQGPKCFCQPGYKLKSDGVTCKTEGTVVPKLFFSTGDEIRSLVLHTSGGSENIKFKEYKNPHADIIYLDYDAELSTLIWFERQSNTVQMMDQLRSKKVLVEANDVTGLSLDWITKNVYFTYTSHNGLRKVGIINLNKSQNSTSNEIIDLDLNVTNPTSVVVHPQKSKIIVIDEGGDEKPSRLILADMDGKNMDVLVIEPQGRMQSVTIDYVTDIIYWSEINQAEARVEMMKFGGSKRKTLISTKDNDIRFSTPTSLAVFENVLYFSTNNSEEIWAVDSLSGKANNFVNGHPAPILKAGILSRVLDLRVFHPSMQRYTKGNSCQFTNCSHLCVLRPERSSCLCPQSMNLVNGKTCLDSNHSSIDPSDRSLNKNESSTSTTTTSSTDIRTTTLKLLRPSSTNSLSSSSSESDGSARGQIQTRLGVDVLPDSKSSTKQDVSFTFCTKPKIPSSGGKLFIPKRMKQFAFGTQIVYSCKNGWHMQGKPPQRNITLTCLRDGNWDVVVKPCLKHTCKSLKCGNNGRCVVTSTGEATCQCSDGTLSSSACTSTSTMISSTSTSSEEIQPPQVYKPGKVIAIVLVLLLLPSFCAFLLWKFIKKSKKYLLIKKHFRAAPIYRGSATDDNREMISKLVLDESEENLSSVLSKHRGLSSVSDENDSGVDRSNSSLSSGGSPGSYNYKRLKETDDTLVSIEDTEDDSPLNRTDSSKIPH